MRALCALVVADPAFGSSQDGVFVSTVYGSDSMVGIDFPLYHLPPTVGITPCADRQAASIRPEAVVDTGG